MSSNPATATLEINVALDKELQIPYLSIEEFYAFCAANPDLRIEREKDGKVIVRSPVGLMSGFYEGEMYSALHTWNTQSKLGICFSPSTAFTLPDGAIKSPDAAWISKAKWQKIPKTERKRFSRVVPDFVVEIRSATDSLKKLKAKMTNDWIENGVQLAWLIDPVKQSAYTYRVNGSVELTEGFHHKLSGEKVLPGFAFDLSSLLIED